MRLQTILLLGFFGLSQTRLFAEDIPYVVDKPLMAARNTLLKAGWKPRETCFNDGFGDSAKSWGEAELLYKAGVIEVEYCNGTGAGYCFYNYSKRGQCLRLLSKGEFSAGGYQPGVIRQFRECPPVEARVCKSHLPQQSMQP